MQIKNRKHGPTNTKSYKTSHRRSVQVCRQVIRGIKNKFTLNRDNSITNTKGLNLTELRFFYSKNRKMWKNTKYFDPLSYNNKKQGFKINFPRNTIAG